MSPYQLDQLNKLIAMRDADEALRTSGGTRAQLRSGPPSVAPSVDGIYSRGTGSLVYSSLIKCGAQCGNTDPLG